MLALRLSYIDAFKMFLLLSFQSLAFNSYKETFSLVKLQLTSVLAHLEGVSIAFSKIVAPFSISVEFSCSVMSDSLWPHEPQHTRPPWPSPTPRVHSNPCPLSQWCQSIISFSAVPFSSCPQPFPVSTFPSIRVFSDESALHMRWPKYWSFSFNISPSKEYPGLITFRMD